MNHRSVNLSVERASAPTRAFTRLCILNRQAVASRRDDIQYSSKLDEFETFVSRAKYPSLHIVASGAAHQSTSAAPGSLPPLPLPPSILLSDTAAAAVGPRPKLLLIDDVPHVTDAESRRRLSAALRDLVLTSRGPVGGCGIRTWDFTHCSANIPTGTVTDGSPSFWP